MSTSARLYSLAGPRVQARLDRARYATGRLPRVAQPDPAFHGWPQPHKACFVVSADLELAWAWRYAHALSDPRRWALRLAERTRENMPRLLEAFSRSGVPVTWATVGHLFLESCERAGGRAHPDLPRQPYFTNELWTYLSGDWFDDDPCSDVAAAPEWYAPDLVDRIAEADPRHEIGCHTFSHVDFSDELCPPGVARAEVAATVAAAAARGHEVSTMVFPGNRAGNFAALRDNGLAAYRHHDRYHLDVPSRDEFGLWRIPGGLCWERPPGWATRPWTKVLRRCLDRAIESGTLLHLWFHPSCDAVNVEEVFPSVLEHLEAAGDEIWRATMRDVVEWVAGQRVVER